MDSPLRLAILDCDGTLVNSQRAIIDAMGKAFAEHGLEPSEAEAVRRIVGLELGEAVSRLMPEAGGHTHARVTQSYRKAAHAQRAKGLRDEPLYPGAREAIEAFASAGWLLGIATGKSDRGLAEVLTRHGIHDHFVTRQTSDTAPGKPSPEMLFQALSETGVEVGSAVMIGDTTFDMEMANNAGMAAIGVAWGYHARDDLAAAGAHCIVERFDQLPATADALVAG